MIHLLRPRTVEKSLISDFWCRAEDGTGSALIHNVECERCLQELATAVGRRLRDIRPRAIDSRPCRLCHIQHVAAFDPRLKPRVRVKATGHTAIVIEWRAYNAPLSYRIQFDQVDGLYNEIAGDQHPADHPQWRGDSAGRANVAPCEIEAIP